MAALPPWSPADVDRFMRLVDKLPSGCWFYTGQRSRGKGNRKWYGTFSYTSVDPETAERRRVRVRAHRFSCEAVGGREPLPPGHDREHRCVFSLCVNPDCIDYVTKERNHELKIERRRAAALRASQAAASASASGRVSSALRQEASCGDG